MASENNTSSLRAATENAQQAGTARVTTFRASVRKLVLGSCRGAAVALALIGGWIEFQKDSQENERPVVERPVVSSTEQPAEQINPPTNEIVGRTDGVPDEFDLPLGEVVVLVIEGGLMLDPEKSGSSEGCLATKHGIHDWYYRCSEGFVPNWDKWPADIQRPKEGLATQKERTGLKHAFVGLNDGMSYQYLLLPWQ